MRLNEWTVQNQPPWLIQHRTRGQRWPPRLVHNRAKVHMWPSVATTGREFADGLHSHGRTVQEFRDSPSGCDSTDKSGWVDTKDTSEGFCSGCATSGGSTVVTVSLIATRQAKSTLPGTTTIKGAEASIFGDFLAIKWLRLDSDSKLKTCDISALKHKYYLSQQIFHMRQVWVQSQFTVKSISKFFLYWIAPPHRTSLI